MKDNVIVKKTLSFIEKHLNEDLSLDGIAQELNYSKYYINRVFAREVGCTIYKYIQTRRLTESARLLVETEKPIAQIAQSANYNSQQAYTLAFHQYYLCTPQVYRQRAVFSPKRPKLTMNLMMGGRMAA